MNFTGERFIPSVEGRIRYEHLHRYALAMPLAAGKSVLDIASGEGYGSAMLARTSRSVVGVDIDIDTVREARRSYAVPGLAFVAADCTAVPLASAAFDLITSFETIEHHAGHQEMLDEFKRLLRPDGVLVISSPNRETYSADAGVENPYHVRELDFAEFDGLLRERFAHLRVFGQRLATSSFVAPLDERQVSTIAAWTEVDGTVAGRVLADPDPIYFVAVCSDRSLDDIDLSSVYLERGSDLLGLLEQEKQQQVERMAAHVAEVQTEMGRQRDGYISEIERHTVALASQQSAFQAERERQAEAWTTARRVYETEINNRDDSLRRAAADNQELARSQQEMARSLEQANVLRVQLQSELSEARRVVEVQSETIRRQSDVLNWIYQSRVWRVSTRLRGLLDSDAGWLKALRAVQRTVRRVHGPDFRGAIERAKFDPAYPGVLEIAGWVYSRNSSVGRVEAFLDDRYLGQLDYGRLRVDVAGRFGAPEACGYGGRVALGGGLANGRRLKVRVFDEFRNRQVYLVSVPLEPVLAPSPDVPTVPDRPAPPPVAETVAPVADERPEDVVAREEFPDARQGLGAAVDRCRPRIGREPSILDWTAALALERAFPDSPVCSPQDGSGPALPYLDSSIDIVVVDSSDRPRLQEARRVATLAVATLERGSADIEWLTVDDAPFALPNASIIIPVFNQVRVTEDCLRELDRTLGDSFEGEIIVVDDASTDQTPVVLERWARNDSRIRVLRNESNSGFVASCNRGADAATGDVLVFLNNDTLPRPGWLTSLIRVFADVPDAGIVSGKLIYLDGTLQEAGGVVFSDGSACNFGKNEDANAPLFNFFREVDYCSGALLATPRALFAEIGGFDRRFEPAYYEDTDYAFEVRSRGYRVLFTPESAVVHLEGVSAGTDTNSGMKRYQVLNRSRFVEKWSDELRRQPAPPLQYDSATLHRLSVRGPRRRLLVCAHVMPEFDREGGSRRIFHLLQFFQRAGWAVSFVADNGESGHRYARVLQRSGIATYVLHVPWSGGGAARIDFEKLVANGRFDMILFAFWTSAERNLQIARRTSPRSTVVIDSIDIHFLRQSRRTFSESPDQSPRPELDEAFADQMRREVNAYAAADAVLTVSTKEADIVNDLLGRNAAFAIPDTEDSSPSPVPLDERRGMLFVGNFRHPPNVQAVEYLCTEIVPHIPVDVLARHPIYIVGNDPGEAVTRRVAKTPHVHLVGWVPSIVPYLERVRVSLTPLRYGAGTKRKLMQSAMVGTPSVSTSIGVEGLDLEHGKHVLVADDPRQFAAAIVRLVRDDVLWEQIAHGGREAVAAVHGTEAVYRRFSTVIGDVSGQCLNVPLFVETFSEIPKGGFDRELDRSVRDRALTAGHISGVCNIKGETTRFIVDSDNMRESLQAEVSTSINRHRQLICALSIALFDHPRATLRTIVEHINEHRLKVFVPETYSIIPKFLEANMAPGLLVLSEYFGPGHRSGERVKNVLHQDLQQTSFADGEFDIVITSEIFEHVPEVEAAEREVMRILKPGGVYAFTIPFGLNLDEDWILASMKDDGTIEYHEEPQYHQDPLRPEGILVYRLFSYSGMHGRFRAMGHRFETYRLWSDALGILGDDCWAHVVWKGGVPQRERDSSLPFE